MTVVFLLREKTLITKDLGFGVGGAITAPGFRWEKMEMVAVLAEQPRKERSRGKCHLGMLRRSRFC